MVKRKGGKKSNEKVMQGVVNSAVQYGVKEFFEKNPNFKDFQEYVVGHLNQEAIGKKTEEIYKSFQGKPVDSKEFLKYVHENISEYVSSGKAFDETGKEVILEEGLKKRGLISKVLHFRNKENYIGKTVGAYRDLSNLIQSGNYSERMPELAAAVGQLNDAVFLDAAVKSLTIHGVIGKREARGYREKLIKMVEYNEKEAKSSLEKYVGGVQQIAASIIGLAGIFFLFVSQPKITGNVIGNLSSEFKGIAGIFLIIIAVGLFYFKKK